MTACNETQKLSGKKAVGATLAGVLAVGMVPAAAFATDEAPEGGIETLAIAPADAFSAGTITGITINGTPYSGAALSNLSLVNNKAYTIAVTQVTLADGTVVDTSNSATGYYTVSIAGPATTNPIAADSDPGIYKVTVAAGAKTPYNGGDTTASADIKLTAPSIQGATLFNKIDGNTDVTQTAFFYTGKEQRVGVALDGKEITPKTIAYFEADKLTPVTDANLKNAGTYWAKITSDQDATTEIQFTVAPLNLSSASIVMNDTNATQIAVTDIKSINGIDISEFSLASNLAFQITSGGAGMTDGGQYTCLITPSATAADAGNVTGQKSVPFAKVDAMATFKYDSAAWSPTKDIDLAQGESFDISKITAEYGSSVQVPADAIDVTITNAAGRTVTAATMNSTPGVYTVTAAVNAAALNYAAGGKEICTVTVVEDTLEDADIYVTYKGDVVDTISATYNGSNVMDDINVTVLDAKGNALRQGVDYTIEVTDDNDNDKAVSQVVNKGDYTLTIKSANYGFSGTDNEVAITVAAVTLTTPTVDGTITVKGGAGDVTFLPFGGQPITPVIKYDTGKTEADGTTKIWATLPADAYEATIQYLGKDGSAAASTVASIDKAGYYTVTLNPNADNAVMSANYSVTANTEVVNAKTGATLFVSDERFFLDVPASSWFYEDVYKAAELGYVKGIGDTGIFAPDNAIKRGDVAVILFRMAGGVEAEGNYPTGFSDVDSNAYWAQAIAWAADAGIVNGYGDTGTFGPNDTVTREQFAKMLGAYAKAVGNFTPVADPTAELAGYVDGSAVADWATDYMAWATQSGYINGYGDTKVLDPAGNVTRAQVAKIAVAYQPDGAPTTSIPAPTPVP